ncbi:MAG: hypothetical protein AAF637_27250 [Pseudomonadota bacterium]
MTEAEQLSWQEAVQVFAGEGLPEPPHLSCWPKEVARIGPGIFGNWLPQSRPYELAALLRETLERGPADAVVFGIDGHGVQSWAAHMVLRNGPLLIGFQIAASGIYTDQEKSAERLEGAWGMLADLDAELARPELAPHLPAGKTLVILDSDVVQDRWAWLSGPKAWDAASWHEEMPAAFLGLMQLRGLAETD